jgi:hypothetical protein
MYDDKPELMDVQRSSAAILGIAWQYAITTLIHRSNPTVVRRTEIYRLGGNDAFTATATSIEGRGTRWLGPRVLSTGYMCGDDDHLRAA